MLDVSVADDSLVVEDVDKVQMIGQPSKSKHRHHDDEHPNDLHSVIQYSIS